MSLRELKNETQNVIFTELTPYTASLRELKNETQSVIFTEPTPCTASLRESNPPAQSREFLPNLHPIWRAFVKSKTELRAWFLPNLRGYALHGELS